MFSFVLHKFVDKAVPDDVIKSIMDKKPGSMGVALLGKDGDLMPLVVNEKDKITEALLKDLFQKEALDRFVMAWFRGEPCINESDVQPFVVGKTAKGMPNILAMLEGDFNPKTDSSHTAEYHVADEGIGPFVKQIAELVGDDYDKLAKQLQAMQGTIAQFIPTKGSVSLLLPNSSCITIKKSDTAKEMDFGWMSDSLGVQVPKKTSALDALKAKVAGAVAPIISDASKLIPAAEPTLTKPPEDKPRMTYADIKLRFPPSHFHDKALKNWYKTTGGYVPANIEANGNPQWMNRVGILDKRGQTDFKMLKKIDGEDINAKIILPEMLLAAQQGKEVKKEEPKVSKIDELKAKVKPPEPIAAVNTGDMLPLLGAEDRENLAEGWLKKVMDEDGIEMPMEPSKIKNMEKARTLFTEMFGLDGISQVFKWKETRFEELAKQDPRAAGHLMKQMRLELLMFHAIESKRTEKKSGLDALKDKVRQAM